MIATNGEPPTKPVRDKAPRCRKCGAACDYASSGRPCWGRVEEVKSVDANKDVYVWARTCQGHEWVAFGFSYVEPPKGKL